MKRGRWEEVVVAVAFMILISSIMLLAIARYDSENALKMWTALGPLVGFLTGAVLTRFFGTGG